MILRILFIISGALSVLLTACGGAAPSPMPIQTEPIEVRVDLNEFKIESSLNNFQKGVPYRLVIHNAGAIAHEFVILPTGAQHNMSSMSGMSHGTMPGMSHSAMPGMDESVVVQVNQDELAPGATRTVDVVFKEDTRGAPLEMACHIPGHYEAGMKLDIAVN
ncbi:MAG: hypothetical protein EYC68_05040 [Chloroflexota bacterium]|nr:MAG: hypothetical protein EYC68_05040 [Chloroflexota bacterium]